MSARQLVVGILGLTVLALIAVVAIVNGWSPGNLFWGPQYEERSEPQGNSRTNFVTETVPQLYPKLIASLTANGPEKVRWMAQTGAPQEQLVFLNDGGLEIETSVFIGTSPSSAPTSTDKTLVRMRDANLDGTLDAITYTEPSGRTHTYSAPFDETSRYLWDTALALTFQVGRCCN